MLNKEIEGIIEKALMEQFMRERPEVLDDDMEDAFESWLDTKYEEIKSRFITK